MDQPNEHRAEGRGKRRRPVVWIAAIVGVVLAYFIAAAVIPRWWAQRVADVVDGRLLVGGLFGLFVGFVFTVVPLGLAYAIVRWRSRRRRWQGWVGWIALILLTGTPNLMTLGVVLGASSAARQGRTTLDSQGPGFRLWSLLGAIAAFAAVGVLANLARSRRRSRREVSKLRDELRTREESQSRDDPEQA